MISEKIEQLKKRALLVRLDPGKKAAMRQNLVHFMDAHEALVAQPVSATIFDSLFTRRFFAPAGVAAVLVLLTGGASLAAENALPGDALYSMKVNVNESVTEALSFSEVAKAEWHARVAERRLEEADKLALAGRLNEDAHARIEANFESSASKAEAKLADLSAKGNTVAAAEISNRFESSLKAHAEILAKLDPAAEDEPPVAAMMMAKADAKMEVKEATPEGKLRRKIGTVIGSLSKARKEAEVKTVAEDTEDIGATEKTIANAADAIASVKVFLDRNRTALIGDADASASLRLASAEKLLSEARQKISSGASLEALALANKAIRAARETRVLAEAQLRMQYEAAAAPAGGASLNLLSVENPEDSDEDSVIMGAVGEGATSSATTSESGAATPQGSTDGPTLNVDGGLKVETH